MTQSVWDLGTLWTENGQTHSGFATAGRFCRILISSWVEIFPLKEPSMLLFNCTTRQMILGQKTISGRGIIAHNRKYFGEARIRLQLAFNDNFNVSKSELRLQALIGKHNSLELFL